MQGVFDGAVFSGCDLSLAQLDGSSFVGTRYVTPKNIRVLWLFLSRYIGCTSERVSIVDATVDWFKCRWQLQRVTCVVPHVLAG